MDIQHHKSASEAFHRDVIVRITEGPKKDVNAEDRATHIFEPRFTVDDFVVLRKAQNGGANLSFKWQGLQRILATMSALLNFLEQLGTLRQEKLDYACLFRYDGGLDGENVLEDVLGLTDLHDAKTLNMEKILDIGL